MGLSKRIAVEPRLILWCCHASARTARGAGSGQEEQVAERGEDSEPEDEALNDIGPDDRLDAAEERVEDRYDGSEQDDAIDGESRSFRRA